MENFRKKFLEEATDLINELEQALLLLEKSPDDQKLVEQVFRVMHSLKGGGAMFGFEEISEYTHHLESIYDFVRNGKLSISKDLLNITLHSVDHLKVLLQKEDQLLPEVKKQHEKLTKEILKLLEDIENGNTFQVQQDQKNQQTPQQKKAKKQAQNSTFHIYFEPKPNIFDNGTNPLYLLDELHTLGQCKAIARIKNLPDFNQLEPQKCYIAWEIFLATANDSNAIRDIFIFVEDDCLLQIQQISEKNLFENQNFQHAVQQANKHTEKLTKEKFLSWINPQKQEPNQSQKKQQKKQKTTERSLKEKVQQAQKTTKQHEHAIASIRVSSDKLDQLMNLVSELVTTQARLSLYVEAQNTDTELLSIAEEVQKLSRQLRDNAFDICLVPIENMVTRFRRLVRDLANEMEKEINFTTQGTETELDKNIIENLAEPIMHIIRNSIDHGIENLETRRRAGKPEKGQILLKAYYSGASVYIQISDDGAGISHQKLKNKAIKQGIIAPDAAPTEKEILNMIFLPGFSTAQKLTGVSGRGVGMDVVKRKIDEMRGEVDIESQIKKGTTITIKLPLTLSIIDGLLVKVRQTHFILPLSVVNKIYEAPHEKLIDNFNNLIVFDGVQIPFLYLRHEFEMPDFEGEVEQVVVVNYEDKQIGLAVDAVVGEYQAVLKPLGKFFKKQEIISGATILGDGTVALVMDTNKIIKQFANLT